VSTPSKQLGRYLAGVLRKSPNGVNLGPIPISRQVGASFSHLRGGSKSISSVREKAAKFGVYFHLAISPEPSTSWQTARLGSNTPQGFSEGSGAPRLTTLWGVYPEVWSAPKQAGTFLLDGAPPPKGACLVSKHLRHKFSDRGIRKRGPLLKWLPPRGGGIFPPHLAW